MRKGTIVSESRTHNLNVAFSTDAELTSINVMLAMIICCKYLMEAQGCKLENDLLYKNNRPIIFLAKNRQAPARKKSKHIINRYSLIINNFAREYLVIHQKVSEMMLNDENTKTF